WDGGWHRCYSLGERITLVGDDLFATEAGILTQGIGPKSASIILIKPYQIGTLTETLVAIDMAVRAGYSAVVSHRSGETEDATIAVIAAATGATQIKAGSLCRSARRAKYYPLLPIVGAVGTRAAYSGAVAFQIKL